MKDGAKKVKAGRTRDSSEISEQEWFIFLGMEILNNSLGICCHFSTMEALNVLSSQMQ